MYSKILLDENRVFYLEIKSHTWNDQKVLLRQ